MPTPHIAADEGAFAEDVLLPGDPRRAQHIAEEFLTDARQVKEIAEKKMVDLNANDVDQAARIIAGSARSMGLEVVE